MRSYKNLFSGIVVLSAAAVLTQHSAVLAQGGAQQGQTTQSDQSQRSQTGTQQKGTSDSQRSGTGTMGSQPMGRMGDEQTGTQVSERAGAQSANQRSGAQGMTRESGSNTYASTLPEFRYEPQEARESFQKRVENQVSLFQARVDQLEERVDEIENDATQTAREKDLTELENKIAALNHNVDVMKAAEAGDTQTVLGNQRQMVEDLNKVRAAFNTFDQRLTGNM